MTAVRIRAAAPVAAAVLALGLGACGVQAPDLFALRRSGTVPGARLTLVVNDGGTVRCNGRRPVQLPSDLLLDSRDLARAIEPDTKAHRRFPPRPRSVLRYRVRTEDGAVTWADTSRPLPERYFRLAFLAREIAQRACRLAR